MIIVFAKAPVPGEVKTRLIPRLGPWRAARLHVRLTLHALSTARAARCGPVELHLTRRHSQFKGARLQRGRDLGERMLGSEDPDAASIRSWLHEVRTSPEHKEMMDLALLIREVTSRGEAERHLAREILQAVIRFSDKGGEAPYLA